MTSAPDERRVSDDVPVETGAAASMPLGIDPTGVPRPGEGRAVAILLVGAVLALIALIATLGWIVYNHV